MEAAPFRPYHPYKALFKFPTQDLDNESDLSSPHPLMPQGHQAYLEKLYAASPSIKPCCLYFRRT